MMMVKRYNIVINKETSTKHLFYCEILLLISQVGYCHSKLLVHTTYNESDRSNK